MSGECVGHRPVPALHQCMSHPHCHPDRGRAPQSRARLPIRAPQIVILKESAVCSTGGAQFAEGAPCASERRDLQLIPAHDRLFDITDNSGYVLCLGCQVARSLQLRKAVDPFNCDSKYIERFIVKRSPPLRTIICFHLATSMFDVVMVTDRYALPGEASIFPAFAPQRQWAQVSILTPNAYEPYGRSPERVTPRFLSLTSSRSAPRHRSCSQFTCRMSSADSKVTAPFSLDFRNSAWHALNCYIAQSRHEVLRLSCGDPAFHSLLPALRAKLGRSRLSGSER